MLVRTSSGNTSVGHLSHSPHGFSVLHRPDVNFQCGGLVFPVHSLLLSVSSSFFCDFFSYLRKNGQARPDTISLDAVKCGALSAVSMSYYLDWAYSGTLPSFDEICEAVELLRLAAFFGNAPLVAALAAHLAAQLSAMPEAELLEVFRAAVDLKHRRLTTDCLVLLLPQFGTSAADTTVAAAIDHMDAALSKAVLTQLAVLGGASPLQACASVGDEPSFACAPSDPPPSSPEGVCTPGRSRASDGGEAGGPVFAVTAAAELKRLKAAFVRVLEAKNWGQ
ncbi:Zinc finger and BTB domain-containing [Micractinium conductrix]|uniref:Zinc finger and BTB domain-containing n=1 Tax=Micractinium conductrix TaxID=554055 RepID=A0A2P6V7B2_9CHLO|nr:Zinc finger and BTB domain-containing [Micractinium conductrix]|eukprot:PSC69973.1 Zinc finger and BTB domain-containing [Micractinium conductrix]